MNVFYTYATNILKDIKLVLLQPSHLILIFYVENIWLAGEIDGLMNCISALIMSAINIAITTSRTPCQCRGDDNVVQPIGNG